MRYCYLDDVATADIAFEAWGHSKEELFTASADATMNIMVQDLNSIGWAETREKIFRSENLEMLLFQFLQEFVYYKDAEKLLLRVERLRIDSDANGFKLEARMRGEKIKRDKHALQVDIKAVTLHLFNIAETQEGLRARVVLDI